MALVPTDMAMLPSKAIFNGNRANLIWQTYGRVAQLAEGTLAAGV
jgi:hypothetical protein